MMLRQAIRYYHGRIRSTSSCSLGDDFSFTEGLSEIRAIDPYYLTVIQRTISKSPEFFRLASCPRISHAFRELFGIPINSPLYLISNGVVFTFPESQGLKRTWNFEIDWHTDIFYTIPRSSFYQLWGPLLSDSSKELGTLSVCPGSHKSVMPKHKVNLDVGYNYRYTVEPIEVDKYELKPIELELGQLLIFHGGLIHIPLANEAAKIN